jgi:hypothetical protein
MLKMEIQGRLEQQRSEKFYLQRRERKGMGNMQKDRETGSPPSQVGHQVLKFFIASGRSMFWLKDFGSNRCFLGRRGGVSLWLITIFGEHVDLLHSTL